MQRRRLYKTRPVKKCIKKKPLGPAQAASDAQWGEKEEEEEEIYKNISTPSKWFNYKKGIMMPFRIGLPRPSAVLPSAL
jgi:hypothetical protein